MRRHRTLSQLKCALASGFALIAICTTGCQIDVGGQTLPSSYYLTDDVQYFPAGPEFQLTREAEAMRIYAEDQPSEPLSP
jgi:hypothetical protein